MPFSGISTRKSWMAPLPTSSGGYGEEKPMRGRTSGRGLCGANAGVYGAVVITSLVWLVLLHVTGVRDWAILCGRGEVAGVDVSGKVGSESGGYGLSYIASSQDDGVGSGLVELMDGEGKRSEAVRPKVLAFVGINTGFDSGPRRASLRETWFPSTPEGLNKLEESTGLVFRFVIGHTDDARKMKALDEEVQEHKDFLLLDVDEQYSKLTLKTLAFFRTAYSLYDADFYMKIDDDIYLRPDRLATLLSKPRESPMVYLGCMKKGPVITEPKFKWYEPQAYMLGSEYFLHAYGPIYALSKEVVANLAANKNQRYRKFINEDVTIGAWMLGMDVVYEDNRAICANECGPTSVAVWDLPKCSGLCNPTKRMLELHKDEMCSKSP
ncbi:hypothetical protein M758_6G117000 [Ceratodon purpureus]|nr:hypothetical protein M758_6G117000 [Ceratodon purpureus]